MPDEPRRYVIQRGFNYWQKPGSFVIWFEAGKDWAHGLIEGTWWGRTARGLVLGTISPGFGLGLELVLDNYRGKLKRYIGPNGIWVALKVADPGKPPRLPLPLVYAKKRTDANKSKAPDPWDPPSGNVWPG